MQIPDDRYYRYCRYSQDPTVTRGKLIFTDYLHLYKFKDSWKIVGKIFYRH
ncbi:MAG: hypothetical protein D4R64_03680 [Porphyromonadaceae bacterium]|nr:MAG: hypothetical protein D4R64_03680 [Porphyromonadaceae bacterium]